jgi:hypothetical protein|nr:hypothetical protein [Kribbella pratensis]
MSHGLDQYALDQLGSFAGACVEVVAAGCVRLGDHLACGGDEAEHRT